MHNLTVFETLKFSCEISSAKSTKNKVKKVEKIIKQFGIMKIRDTMIERCSGGQQRRISIAVELFSNPNCLILDEPTTGLDSASCASVVKILKEIVQTRKYPMATLATIHQPSYAVFTDFNLIYIINRYGQNLYIGLLQSARIRYCFDKKRDFDIFFLFILNDILLLSFFFSLSFPLLSH